MQKKLGHTRIDHQRHFSCIVAWSCSACQRSSVQVYISLDQGFHPFYEWSLGRHVGFGKLKPLSRQRLLPEPSCAIITGGDQRIACKQTHKNMI